MAPNTLMPDPPAPLTAKTVVRTDFSTTRRGFDPDEVAAHLGRVGEHVADLESTIADLKAQLRQRESLAADDDAARSAVYETTAARIADLVRTFDQDMERMRGQAEARLAEARANAERVDGEAEKLRVEAETEAARIVAEAHEQADRMRAEADRSAHQAVASLEARRDALVASLREIRDVLRRSGESVESILHGSDDDVLRVDDEPAQDPVPRVWDPGF